MFQDLGRNYIYTAKLGSYSVAFFFASTRSAVSINTCYEIRLGRISYAVVTEPQSRI